jgi:hypothetical protein
VHPSHVKVHDDTTVLRASETLHARFKTIPDAKAIQLDAKAIQLRFQTDY